MGMFSEITTEGCVHDFAREIKTELSKTSNPETITILKRLGRWSLRQFEWSTPDWASEFEKAFKEEINV